MLTKSSYEIENMIYTTENTGKEMQQTKILT